MPSENYKKKNCVNKHLSEVEVQHAITDFLMIMETQIIKTVVFS